jgi:hypothetical protein
MAKKKSSKNKGQKMTPSKRKAGAGARAMARSGGGKRRTAGAKTPKGKTARKKTATSGSRKSAKSSAGRRGARKTATRKAARRSQPTRRQPSPSRARKATTRRKTARGGSGREETLAQTPETGRTVKGPTNPMPTRRSTGTPAGAGSSRHAPGLDRARKQLREVDETVQGPPSSLDMDRNPSAARSGRRRLQDALDEHHETSPAMTGGDVDADWEDAYAVGDEAPGGDNPTPDQDRVDDIGKALGVEYQDNEELKGADKIAERDKHRWELDPASSDDYRERE